METFLPDVQATGLLASRTPESTDPMERALPHLSYMSSLG